ncbi:MAG: hypothetical protein HZB39_04000 [Planctomycetes bacterium]|nr:hypothetical protein [Planctomycetota bacterium]
MTRHERDEQRSNDRRLDDKRFADERLADWIDGRLDEVQLQRFEAEMRVNPELRAAAEEYRSTVRSIREALRAGERVDPGFAVRVMRAIDDERRDGPPRRWFPWAGSAAAAVLLVALWFALPRTREAAPASETAVAHAPADAAPASRDDEDAPRVAEPGTHFGDTGKDLAEAERGARDRLEPKRSFAAVAGQERRLGVEQDLTGGGGAGEGGAKVEEQVGFVMREQEPAAAFVDPGQLVYLVEVPAAALLTLKLDGVATVEDTAKPDESKAADRKDEAAREGRRRDSTLRGAGTRPAAPGAPASGAPPAEVPAQGEVVAKLRVEALAVEELAKWPLTQQRDWASNVMLPQFRPLQAAPVGGANEDQTPANPGAYRFQAGDVAFELEGDESQVQQYLRLLATPVRQAQGSIAVQRAVEPIPLTRVDLPAIQLDSFTRKIPAAPQLPTTWIVLRTISDASDKRR